MVRNQLLLSRKYRDPIRSYYWAIRRIMRWHARPELGTAERGAIRRGILDGLCGVVGPFRSTPYR